ncbi:helix-turn-helix domain-containing protein [Rossellomorea marisflavi]|uniref:helix-turn-helix domain-containing protein n=1 Tax=Rossellomorea marisflavi TaxID=189381 RepID=UPI00064E91CB|nr:helix-turn-helix domain-containing protein [Rossellomorea marisflavi]KMK95942.1 XRE family transcriptional regulator [Rossellomorea marisflavi]KML01126.1 XRE family transcriptional regulator [Rossellomorea marisflavi]TYO74313.1 helix-turn-helix transcriptional regulator [Rossellomorea marisflavi]
MDFAAVGKKIKELRKNSGLSQEELSEGICTQAQISKIEKGLVFPYASTLYQISQKLGVDVNYFFDIGTTPRLDYVQEVFQQLQIMRRSLRFKEMMDIVRAEEVNPLFSQNKKNLQLLLWHKGIYLYEVENKKDEAINTLNKAVHIADMKGKVIQEREIEILLTIGAIYYREDINAALPLFEEIIRHVQLLPHLNDYTIKTRLYFNLARTLTSLERLDESNIYCDKAIKWCLQKDSIYLLGEIHYQKGYNLELINQPVKAKSYMEKALIVFELQQDDKYLNFIKDKINQLSN